MIGFLNGATLCGMLLAPYIRDISYTFTLAVSAVMSAITFFYILIFLKESVSISEVKKTWTTLTHSPGLV